MSGKRLPLAGWVEERLAEILAAGYSGPITLDCRDGRVKRVVPVVVFTEADGELKPADTELRVKATWDPKVEPTESPRSV